MDCLESSRILLTTLQQVFIVTEDSTQAKCVLICVEQNDRAEIGYSLGREHWGKGYMHEALTALVEFAFGEMDLRRLEADTDPRNAPSIRALERLGLKSAEGLAHATGLLRAYVDKVTVFVEQWGEREGA